jgi:glycosyltransferase involved in cell wall biosynthesis
MWCPKAALPRALSRYEERFMRIAIAAPLMEAIPPPLYGGTERVVSTLTEELVRRGHEVTLFASGDSQTTANLVACAPRGLRLDPTALDTVVSSKRELSEVYRRAGDFDLIHNHLDSAAFPFARLSRTPTVTTAHGRLDLPQIRREYASFPEQELISISDSQRAPLRSARWVRTVFNGIDLTHFHFQPNSGDYLVFLGRITPEKRPDQAIAIAREVGMRLIIAAKVDPLDQAYYDQIITPLIRDCPLVEYVGEVNEAGKDTLLGGAYAYLFPIDWPEPFGLTMVEAMATGTPVVAYRAGSVPEVIVDGVTGFVCDSFRAMVDAVPLVGALERRACRVQVARWFSAAAMAEGYEQAYAAMLERPSISSRPVSGLRPQFATASSPVATWRPSVP